ncbi:MAG: thiamine pyrophosphate-binding protein, partial [Rhodospirillales bacterium]|nr:thiamine pyrophosphate-binding protein [Rhodospirillales bacterium]
SGVTHVFFLPSILLHSLAEMEDLGIRRVMVHGEKAAAYMADGYARLSGRPGICCAQQIGASNLSAGLRDAYMACTPMIAFTGGNTPLNRYKNPYQSVEDFTQFDPVTKFNARVDAPQRVPDLLRQAWREATSGTPRPVHLQFGGHHGQMAEGEADLGPVFIEERFQQVPAFRPTAPDEDVKKALAALNAAKRPVIVAGGGVVKSGAQAEVVKLAEMLDIPVATAMNAKGAIADTHRLAVGVVGTYSRACANRTVHEADLVFFIGSQTGGQVTANWTKPPRGTNVIELNIAPADMGRNYPNVASLCGDAKAVLHQLLAAAQPAKHGDWVAHVQGFVKEWRADADAQRKSDATPMRPERVCAELTDLLPADAVLVSDTGHSGIWTGTMIELNHPTQRFLRCAGSLGWAFPAALGAKCAAGDRPVVCWTGDGGFYYHIAELETAARYGINAIIVVNNNSALNQEITLYDSVYNGQQRGNSSEMWKFTERNFAQVAESFGCV